MTAHMITNWTVCGSRGRAGHPLFSGLAGQSLVPPVRMSRRTVQCLS